MIVPLQADQVVGADIQVARGRLQIHPEAPARVAQFRADMVVVRLGSGPEYRFDSAPGGLIKGWHSIAHFDLSPDTAGLHDLCRSRRRSIASQR